MRSPAIPCAAILFVFISRRLGELGTHRQSLKPTLRQD
jgi:hypothetical protein